jgi:ketosteroid isomerase-like protein
MYTFRTVLLVTLGSALLGCSPPDVVQGPSEAEDLAAIAQARDQLIAALVSDDVPGIMVGLTEDHFTMPPDQPTPSDNTVLAGWHEARVEQFSFETEFTTDDLRLYGDLAIERWTASQHLMPKGEGEEITDSTKGVWIWERQEDGSWKLLWSIWNSNLPAEGMPISGEGAYEVAG